MQSMSARDAKNAFGKLIDIARVEPVTIEKHGRPVAVVMSIEKYEVLADGGTATMKTRSGPKRGNPKISAEAPNAIRKAPGGTL